MLKITWSLVFLRNFLINKCVNPNFQVVVKIISVALYVENVIKYIAWLAGFQYVVKIVALLEINSTTNKRIISVICAICVVLLHQFQTKAYMTIHYVILEFFKHASTHYLRILIKVLI